MEEIVNLEKKFDIAMSVCLFDVIKGSLEKRKVI